MPELLEGKAAVGHLLRRAGFGPALESWPTWAALSYDDAVDRVLEELVSPVPADPPGFEPFEYGAIQQLWLDRMVAADSGAAEKLTLFWHGHFATSSAKIESDPLMWLQYKLLRTKGHGSFRELVEGISRDVAMIRWLDGNANRKGHANENYGRELQELFTLGIGHYTEDDIREVARAFTGWGSRATDFVFRRHFHDEGQKTIHGRTGKFDGDDAVDILVSLPACPRFIADKLLRFYSHPDPTPEEVEALAQGMRANDLDVKSTLAALLRSPAFRSPRRRRALVRSPVEFLVAALRATGSRSVPSALTEALVRMGQILFRPPSVKGWTSGSGWMTSASVVERLQVALAIGRAAPSEVAERLLDVAFQGGVPAALESALEGLDPAARTATVLGGPEFQLS